MGFYLRKGFNFGPIRVNLSKSGLGVSAGVKGARIGINSQGRAYVHGGRHGLYYRKNLGSVGSLGKSSGIGNFSPRSTEEIFTDTGNTYQLFKLQHRPLDLKPLVDVQRVWLVLLGILSLLLGLLVSPLIFRITLILLGVGFLSWHFYKVYERRKILKIFESLRGLNSSQQTSEQWRSAVVAIKNQEKLFLLSEHVMDSWLEQQLKEGLVQPLDDILGFLPMDAKRASEIALSKYLEAIDTALGDHYLSSEEILWMEYLGSQWKIPVSEIQEEKLLIRRFEKIRELQEGELPNLYFSRPMVSGEEGYFQGEGRLLVMRVQDTWQSNNVRYKSMGYQVELEGVIRISSRAVEIQEGRNIRSYSLRQIEDVHLIADQGVVEVYIQNRKNPLIFTTPHLFEFAGILVRVSGQGVLV